MMLEKVGRNRLNTLLTYVIHIRWTKKAHSTDQQLVEFTFLIAWEPCVARFNRALGIEADNVSGKGSCLTPVAR
jgi:alkylhydroperoxidase family enzyme